MSASVAIADGPVLPVGTELDPESYTFTSVALAEAAAAGHQQGVALLPTTGVAVLLAVRARTQSGKRAAVTFTPHATGAGTPTPLTIDGELLVWGAGAVAAVLPGGLESLTVSNGGSEPVRVDILACLGGS
ncbi:hypothetical protein [Kitasatospora sp. NPDC087314]|uniref:hypothetical protein n=1 Tax=Kitasatospora sp. NPDC087314 TaxID=3364068 RepID=UPI00382069B2